MKYGLYLPNFGAFGDPAVMVSLAVEAEASGWDGFFIWDHIGGFDNTMVDPWVALGAVALATEHIRLGTTVTPVPRRRPHKLARETVTVDRLSNGRLIFGVGTGEGVAEFDHLGETVDHRVRGDMLDEALEVITDLWRANRVDRSGRHYRVEQTTFVPPPVQQPRIPVWVGGIWPHRKPMRRAANWDGVIPLFDTNDESDLDQLSACIDYISERRSIDTPFDVVYTGVTPGADSTRAQEIVASYRERGVTWWLEAIAPYRYDRDFAEPWDLEILRERVLQGPPAP